MEHHVTATECHLPYGITRCYLLPDTSERTPPAAVKCGVTYSIFDAVLYAVKIVASFYKVCKVRTNIIKLRFGVLFGVCFEFRGVCFWHEFAKLDNVWVSYYK